MESSEYYYPIPLMWEKVENDYVKCNICHNRCLISPGSTSRCISRKNNGGEMELNTFGLISSIAADPIEKKPLYHFYPGTRVLSLGGWGCNFNCLHCQNWQISQLDRKKLGKKEVSGLGGYCISPEELVKLIPENHCRGVSWTYNEPAIWLEYTLQSARLAKEKGYYTAYITNGYITPEALDIIAPYLDAFRVDLKSFDDKFYRDVCGIYNYIGIYETTLHAKKLGLHIETVTNIIPDHNDKEEDLRKIAKWIVDNLDENTPWHVTRFFPYNKLNHLPPTPVEAIEAAVDIGKKEGLKFVYKGNVNETSDTICPECKTIAIQRTNHIYVNLDKNGMCKNCGNDLNIKIN